MSEDTVFQERYFTLRVNGEVIDQIFCSQGHWRELALGYLLSQRRIAHPGEMPEVVEQKDLLELHISSPLLPAAFLTDRLDALRPFERKAEADEALIRRLGRALQENAPFGRHRAVIRHQSGEEAMFDDAGRHNACDKAIGHALLQGWDLGGCILGTSGRLSLEMLGKAACSGIPLLFTLKYPSDLCKDFADRLKLRLVAKAAGESPLYL
jgi:formate dehydrogenase assembly factor FdhD